MQAPTRSPTPRPRAAGVCFPLKIHPLSCFWNCYCLCVYAACFCVCSLYLLESEAISCFSSGVAACAQVRLAHQFFSCKQKRSFHASSHCAANIACLIAYPVRTSTNKYKQEGKFHQDIQQIYQLLITCMAHPGTRKTSGVESLRWNNICNVCCFFGLMHIINILEIHIKRCGIDMLMHSCAKQTHYVTNGGKTGFICTVTVLG